MHSKTVDEILSGRDVGRVLAEVIEVGTTESGVWSEPRQETIRFSFLVPETKDSYEVSFESEREASEDDEYLPADWTVTFCRRLDRHNCTYEIAGTDARRAIQVFKTVMAAVKEFTDTHSVETIHFSAANEKLARLYDRLVKTAPGNFHVRGSSGNYTLTNDDYEQKENPDYHSGLRWNWVTGKISEIEHETERGESFVLRMHRDDAWRPKLPGLEFDVSGRWPATDNDRERYFEAINDAFDEYEDNHGKVKAIWFMSTDRQSSEFWDHFKEWWGKNYDGVPEFVDPPYHDPSQLRMFPERRKSGSATLQ